MIASLLILALAAAEDGNLVRNSGFELLDGSRPASWDLYVAAKPGAKGALDGTVAYGGDYSVKLSTREPYETDPCNNWSQNITQDVSGETLVVTGHIKTEEADGAALWLQCWRADPLGVAHVSTTSSVNPMSGTNDWSTVEMNVRVPAGTDFVTLRCVLKGTGTAWFDDVAVTKREATPRPKPSEAKSGPEDQPSEANATPEAPAKDPSAEPQEDDSAPIPARQWVHVPGIPARNPDGTPKTIRTGREATIEAPSPPASDASTTEDLLRASEWMADTLEATRRTNTTMAGEMERLRAEVEELRELVRTLQSELRARAAAAAESDAIPAPAPPVPAPRLMERRVPVLVPYGYNMESLR